MEANDCFGVALANTSKTPIALVLHCLTLDLNLLRWRCARKLHAWARALEDKLQKLLLSVGLALAWFFMSNGLAVRVKDV